MKRSVAFLLLVVACSFCVMTQAQSLKQYSGKAVKTTRYGEFSGTESYSYYVENGERIIQGTYTFTGKYDMYPRANDYITLTISTNYVDGKLEGLCKATATGYYRYMNTDYDKMMVAHKYTSEFSATVRNGELDGPLVADLVYNLHEMTCSKIEAKKVSPHKGSMHLNFKQGKLVGAYEVRNAGRYLDDFVHAKGQFSNEGKMIGTWVFEKADKIDHWRFMNGVLVDNQNMSDNEIRVAEKLASGGTILDTDLNGSGAYFTQERLCLNFFWGFLAKKYKKDEDGNLQGNFYDISDYFGLGDLKQMLSKYLSPEYKKNEPITYQALQRVDFVSEDKFQDICSRPNAYAEVAYSDAVHVYYVWAPHEFKYYHLTKSQAERYSELSREMSEKMFQKLCEESNYYVIHLERENVKWCKDRRAPFYFLGDQAERYTTLKDSIYTANPKDFEDLFFENYGNFSHSIGSMGSSEKLSEAYLNYKKEGKDILQMIQKYYAEMSLYQMEELKNYTKLQYDRLSAIFNSEQTRYVADSSVIIVATGVVKSTDSRDYELGAWKNEWKDFGLFYSQLDQTYTTIVREINITNDNLEWYKAKVSQRIKDDIDDRLTYPLSGSSSIQDCMAKSAIWNKVIDVIRYDWKVGYRLFEKLSSQMGRNYNKMYVELFYPQSKITSYEALEKYAVQLQKWEIIQKGFVRWEKLSAEVEELDAKIRQMYIKKTLKAYEDLCKPLRKQIDKSPVIVDQTSAEAVCAPLEQLKQQQLEFMNSVTPDNTK